MLDCGVQRPRAAAEIDRAGAFVGRPNIGAAARQVQRPALDVHRVGVVEQRGDRRSRRRARSSGKVPWLFTAAVEPVSPLRLLAKMNSPELVV